MNYIKSLLCRLTAHKWRRLRKGEQLTPSGIMGCGLLVTPTDDERSQVRICARCGQTRLARRRGGKA